jgi:hypothetical protein
VSELGKFPQVQPARLAQRPQRSSCSIHGLIEYPAPFFVNRSREGSARSLT